MLMAESISCICIGCLDLAPADRSKKKKNDVSQNLNAIEMNGFQFI